MFGFVFDDFLKVEIDKRQSVLDFRKQGKYRLIKSISGSIYCRFVPTCIKRLKNLFVFAKKLSIFSRINDEVLFEVADDDVAERIIAISNVLSKEIENSLREGFGI